MISRMVIVRPSISIGLHENTLPMANVAVIKAVFGKTNENQVIEKTIRPPCMTGGRCAEAAMKKKKIASPHSQRQVKFAITLTIIAASFPSLKRSDGKALSAFSAMVRTPATVKALGPTETNIPGRVEGEGKAFVMRRCI